MKKQLTREEIIKNLKEVASLLEKGTGELTPEEQCQVDHSGECGVCNKQGDFTHC